MEKEEKSLKKTFLSKNPIECPICREEFHREELFTGRGRLIAGNLTDELRRNYQENKKFGKIYPLIYSVNVCPQCYYAAFQEDFDLPIKKVKDSIEGNNVQRKNLVHKLFPNIDFTDNRTLMHGLCGYILACTCYSFFDKKHAPSFKVAISAIRAAWVAQDLFNETSDEKYQYISEIFYNKAGFFYNQCLEYSQTGKELLDTIKNFGPDTDNNFGYEGMLYLASLLNYRLGINQETYEMQADELVRSKRIISKMFGTGKASKEKPTAILDLSRDLFELINNRLKELSDILGYKIS